MTGAVLPSAKTTHSALLPGLLALVVSGRTETRAPAEAGAAAKRVRRGDQGPRRAAFPRAEDTGGVAPRVKGCS